MEPLRVPMTLEEWAFCKDMEEGGHAPPSSRQSLTRLTTVVKRWEKYIEENPELQLKKATEVRSPPKLQLPPTN